jgi:hypothetical protein
MRYTFPRWTNRIPLYLGAAIPVVAGGVTFGVWYWFSPKFTDVGYQPRQPVEYSHFLHAGTLGMDCRFCHNTAELAAHAAIPPSQTCMTCHEKLVLPESPKLFAVRQSAKTGEPIPWVRVHMLPDYAYFDHSVHLAAGVGCVTCHGRVDRMKVVYQEEPLSMSWCLTCHRNPGSNLRPRSEITNMKWDAKTAGYRPEADPSRKRAVNPPTYCSGCHR